MIKSTFCILLLACAVLLSEAFTSNGQAASMFAHSRRSKSTIPSDLLNIRAGGTERQMVAPAVASLFAGSVAGAVGVGVAFPLDTLKTKSQVIGSGGGAGLDDMAEKEHQQLGTNLNMFQLMSLIYEAEGLRGFFSGVRGMMMGQALIKAVAFSANAYALALLQSTPLVNEASATSVLVLITAACTAGFVTSFLVAPIERIKIMMQAGLGYKNELECLQSILKTEGFEGLMGRGLGATLAREVPSYGIYFVAYGMLMQTPVATWLGPSAPLIFGALSGCACWAPIYPIDVVKTVQQVSIGEDSSFLQVTRDVYKEGGVAAFFDGITPKMLRAGVNHSVCFYVYDLILRMI